MAIGGRPPRRRGGRPHASRCASGLRAHNRRYARRDGNGGVRLCVLCAGVSGSVSSIRRSSSAVQQRRCCFRVYLLAWRFGRTEVAGPLLFISGDP